MNWSIIKRASAGHRSGAGWLLLFCLSLSGLTGCGPTRSSVEFLSDWSPDGTRLALVPSFLDEAKPGAGLWVIEPGTQAKTEIVRFGADYQCFQPHWSPGGAELLFGVMEKTATDVRREGEAVPFSVWVVAADGQNLRRVADSLSSDEALLLPNALTWGPRPGTIIYPELLAGQTAAIQLDLASGHRQELLPHRADAYALVPAPNRTQWAALFYHRRKATVELYLAAAAQGEWRKIDELSYDQPHLESLSALLFWSPDGTKFVLPAGGRSARNFLRLYDAQTGVVKRFALGAVQGPVHWDSTGSALLFARSGRAAEAGIFRLDLSTSQVTPLVRGTDYYLLAQPPATEHLFFYRLTQPHRSGPAKEAGEASAELYSCTAFGLELQALGRFARPDATAWYPAPRGEALLLFDSLQDYTIVPLDSAAARELNPVLNRPKFPQE